LTKVTCDRELFYSVPVVNSSTNRTVTRLNDTITLLQGIKVGHAHYEHALTGCTVMTLDKDCIVGVDVRGGSPGSYNIVCFQGTATVESADAIFLSGGSWFGLDVAKGVRQYLVDNGIGWETRFGRMPCVTGAIIYDLAVAKPGKTPDSELGYKAAANASVKPVAEGNVGAGIGATVGKLLGMDKCMKGGIGSSAVTLDNGLRVGALVVVNALGNVFNPKTGKTIAGARRDDGRGFVEASDISPNAARALQIGLRPAPKNTTIGIVATNARLSQKEIRKMAEMGHDGIARAVRPAHTTLDGDLLYSVATCRLHEKQSFDHVAHLASEQLTQAIVRAVKKAKSVDSIRGLADKI
jgi:L-aminopeptidase/D-esterase-like protein